MLLEFGIKNFFSFKEGAKISFRLPKNSPDSLSKGKDYSNLLGIKGKNASGKTNVLKAISFVCEFATDSFQEKPEEKIFIENFYNNSEDSEFFVEFRVDGTEFRYEIALDKIRVKREVLYRKVKRWSKVVERVDNNFKTVNDDFKGLKHINLRNNASFISTAHQYSLNDLEQFNSIYDFFNTIISNVSFFGLRQHNLSTESIEKISKHYHDNPKVLEFVKDIICRCDTGVSDIEIFERDDDGKKSYMPVFFHDIDDISEPLTHFTESSGTKSLYMQLGQYALVAQYGGILCFDEFDLNLHPHILPLLLDIFVNEEINVGNGQFLFSTHNNEILDYLGRYRTVFVEKENNESFAYRLDDIPGDILRNDRPILPVYQEGKIGGIPRL
ncbi:ATP/GTP-binding protein [Vibrio cyclitrophicus]